MSEVDLVNFHSLDPQVVLDDVDVVLHEMGRARSSGRVMALNSLENRVYLIELEDGSEVVAKFYRPARWSAAQIAEEHHFLLRALAAEIPVVAPLVCGSQAGSEIKTEAGLGSSEATLFKTKAGIRFSLFPKVRGRLTAELSLKQAEVLGRYLGRLHLLGRSMPLKRRPPLDIHTFGDDALDALESAKIVQAPQFRRYIMLAEEFLDLVDPILSGPMHERAQTVHGDCHIGNILWDGEAPFLLDFDDMSTCLPVQDIWLIAPGRDEENAETRRALLAGYEQFLEFCDDDFVCVEPLRGLRMIHYTAWIARRLSDPIFPATFVDFGSDRYWQEECQALMEAADCIRGF